MIILVIEEALSSLRSPPPESIAAMPPESSTSPANSITILCPLRVEFDALKKSSIAESAEIICTGPGFDAIIRAAEMVRLRHQAEGLTVDASKTIILAGLGGALNSKCPAGSAWVGRSVRDERGQTWPTSWPTANDPSAIGLSMANVLGTDQFFHGINEKAEAARELNVDLVNLEAHALAEWAVSEDYYFGIVQGVRESCTEALPVGFENWLNPDGSLNRKRLGLDLIRHPAQILWRRKTERNSQLALAAMIQLLKRFGLGNP